MCASDPTGPHNRILEREGAWELRLAPEVSVEQSQMARQQELAHREQRIQAAEGIEADGDHTAGQLAYLRSEIQEKDQQLMELAVRCEDTYREAEDAKKKAHSAQQKYEEESLMSPPSGGGKVGGLHGCATLVAARSGRGAACKRRIACVPAGGYSTACCILLRPGGLVTSWGEDGGVANSAGVAHNLAESLLDVVRINMILPEFGRLRWNPTKARPIWAKFGLSLASVATHGPMSTKLGRLRWMQHGSPWCRKDDFRGTMIDQVSVLH